MVKLDFIKLKVRVLSWNYMLGVQGFPHHPSLEDICCNWVLRFPFGSWLQPSFLQDLANPKHKISYCVQTIYIGPCWLLVSYSIHILVVGIHGFAMDFPWLFHGFS